MGVAAVVLAAVVVFALPIASGRTEAPVFSRSSARRALEGARSAGAERWASLALAEAERRMMDAELEFRRQELRLWPLRDFRTARARFLEAQEASARATETAIRLRSESAEGAAAAVDIAQCLVRRAEESHRLFRFGAEVGEAMRESKMRLHEAKTLLAQGEYGLARLRADESAAKAAGASVRMRAKLQRFVEPAEVRSWRGQRDETVAWSRANGTPAIVVNKDRAVLELYLGGRRSRAYDVEIGLNHLQRKLAAGDRATPEGTYRVIAKRGNGRTKYHKALDLDYPNEEDRRRYRESVARSVIPAGSGSGGLIEIHGHGGKGRDWTNGCIALRDEDMDDLFARVPAGTRVTIIGSDGSDGRFTSLARALEDSIADPECRRD